MRRWLLLFFFFLSDNAHWIDFQSEVILWISLVVGACWDSATVILYVKRLKKHVLVISWDLVAILDFEKLWDPERRTWSLPIVTNSGDDIQRN